MFHAVRSLLALDEFDAKKHSSVISYFVKNYVLTNKIDKEIVFYETPDGRVKIEVRFENENLWLSQKLLAALFECTPDNISLHLRNIYETRELSEQSTTEDFSVVQIEGGRKVNRTVKHYSLEAIITVGYRVNSTRGTTK